MRLRRLLLPALILGLAGGYYLWQSRLPAQTETVSLPSVAAVTGNVEEAVLASGALEPVRQVSVGAQVSGRVVSLKVKLGDSVKAGDLIAEIDSVTQQNALRSAEADLAALKAQRAERIASLAYAEAVLANAPDAIREDEGGFFTVPKVVE